MAKLGWSAGYFYVAGLLLTYASAQTTVDCSFDSGTFCNWENVQTDQFDWQLGNSVVVDGFHSIPRTLTGTGSFAYAQGKFQSTLNANNEAQLQSPQVSSLTSPATLTFSYWKTAIPPTLDICTQEDGSSLQCIDTVSGAGPFEWTQRQVIISANPLPFRIVFRARNFNSALDIIGIDDVQFRLATRDAPQSSAPSDPFRAAASGQTSLRNVPLLNIGLPPLEPSTVAPLRVFEPLFPTELATTIDQTRPHLPRFTSPPFSAPPSSASPFSASSSFNAPPFNVSPFSATPFTARRFTVSPFTVPSFTVPSFNNRPFTVPPLDNNNELGDANAFASPFVNSRLAVNRATENFSSSNGVEEPSQSGSLGFVTGPNEQLPGGCSAVQCSFTRDLCNWINVPDDNFDWKQTDGRSQSDSPGVIRTPADQSNAHIYVSGDGRNAQGRTGIRSAEFVVPAGAFVEFAAYMSDSLNGRLAVYQYNNQQNAPDRTQSGNLIWDRTGYDSIGGSGWRRLRVPVRATSFPLTLTFIVDGLSLPQQVIGLDDIKLVNSLGEEIGCGTNLASFGTVGIKGIDPQDIIPQRLTAFQQPSSNASPTARYENYIQDRVEDLQQNGLRGVNDVDFGGFASPPAPQRYTETPPPLLPVINNQPDYPNYSDNNAEWLSQQGPSTVLRPLSGIGETPSPFEEEDAFAGRTFRTLISSPSPSAHTILPPGTTLSELPAIEDRQEYFPTTTVVKDPFLSAIQPIIPVNAPEHLQSLVLSRFRGKPSTPASFGASQTHSLSAIVPILGNAFAPIERAVEQQTARDSVDQSTALTQNESETEPPLSLPEGFQPAIVPIQPVQADVSQPDTTDPQTEQVLNRLTKDIERLFGIPISQTVGLNKGDALFSQATHLSAGDRPLTKENLDFILQNALAGRKRK